MALDNLRQAAQGVVVGNLRRVAGNLPGMLGGSKGDNSSKYKKLDRAKSPHSVDNLQFPIDVDSDPGLGNHGHYMMFYINQQDHAKLKFGDPAEPKQDGKKNITKAMEELNVDKQENVVIKEAQYAQTNITGEKVKVKEAQFGLRANTNSIGKYGLNTDSSNQDKLQSANYQTNKNKSINVKGSTSNPCGKSCNN